MILRVAGVSNPENQSEGTKVLGMIRGVSAAQSLLTYPFGARTMARLA